MSPDILLLAGPTASGKTALSLHAARALSGEIVNADSMQVYAGLDVIAAGPSGEETAAAAHHLFGAIDPGERCSVGRWSRLALERIDEITGRGKTAILVGGTGLYFKALTEGLAPAPDIPASVAAQVEALYAQGGLEALRAEAEAADPDAAAKALDPQRLMRIVAVKRASGTTLTELQAKTEPLIDPARWRGVVIQPPRALLYERIETRFDTMVAAGALEEARALLQRDLDAALPAMKAVGLPPLLAHLRGETDLETAVATAKRDSRRYAKRQYTWFSNQHPGWPRIESLDPAAQRAELARFLGTEFGA